MLTTTLTSDVDCETSQWIPVADAFAGIRVRSITKLRTDRKLRPSVSCIQGNLNYTYKLSWLVYQF